MMGHIRNKDELLFYIEADRIMNGFPQNSIKDWFLPNYIQKFLIRLRRVEYYYDKNRLLYFFNKICFARLSVKLGFSIEPNVFGYGLVIPHYGTIVVGAGNSIGNYAVLHTSICITAGEKVIGDAFYASTGAKIINNITLGNGISIGANSLVNKSFDGDNQMIAGIPADIIKDSEPWFIRDGEEYHNRMKQCEELKAKQRL